MFFTVKYGADEHVLFNPNCSCELLLEGIVKTCHVPRGASIGLANDKYDIINFSDLNSENYSSTMFPDREVYTLLAIYKRESGPPRYQVLLDTADPDLIIKLDGLSNPYASSVLTKMKSRSKMPHSKKTGTSTTNAPSRIDRRK